MVASFVRARMLAICALLLLLCCWLSRLSGQAVPVYIDSTSGFNASMPLAIVNAIVDVSYNVQSYRSFNFTVIPFPGTEVAHMTVFIPLGVSLVSTAPATGVGSIPGFCVPSPLTVVFRECGMMASWPSSQEDSSIIVHISAGLDGFSRQLDVWIHLFNPLPFNTSTSPPLTLVGLDHNSPSTYAGIMGTSTTVYSVNSLAVPVGSTTFAMEWDGDACTSYSFVIPSGLTLSTLSTNTTCTTGSNLLSYWNVTRSCVYNLSWSAPVCGLMEVVASKSPTGVSPDSQSVWTTFAWNFTGTAVCPPTPTPPVPVYIDHTTLFSTTASSVTVSSVTDDVYYWSELSSFNFTLQWNGDPFNEFNVYWEGVPNITAAVGTNSSLCPLYGLSFSSTSSVTSCNFTAQLVDDSSFPVVVEYRSGANSTDVHSLDVWSFAIGVQGTLISADLFLVIDGEVYDIGYFGYTSENEVLTYHTSAPGGGSMEFALIWEAAPVLSFRFVHIPQGLIISVVEGDPNCGHFQNGAIVIISRWSQSTSCYYNATWTMGVNGSLVIAGSQAPNGTPPPNGGAGSGTWYINFIAPLSSTQVLYDSTKQVMTSAGPAVTLLSGSGIRVYTNRFGSSFSTGLTLVSQGLLPQTTGPVLYLNSSDHVDAVGLTFNLSAPLQLPGSAPLALTIQLTVSASSGGVIGDGSALLDSLGSAWTSSIPGFLNLTIPPANVNALAANYDACQAHISFTNGLRSPAQPSNSNGGTLIDYSYFLSDGVSYSVLANLTITTTSAFATVQDQLGNPYQTVSQVIGVRQYTHLATQTTITSQVSYMTTAHSRFYPYALLSSSPGVYSANTAPYFDAEGLTLNLNPSVPTNGAAPGVDKQFNSTSIAFTAFNNSVVLLTEAHYIHVPSLALQQQRYSFV